MTSPASDSLPVLIAFNWVPAGVRGLVRDLRIRWALEEIGQEYHTQLIDPREALPAGYLDWQPFGQVPAFTDGDVKLFETGAILLYLGENDGRLLSPEPATRWATTSWLFAALNSMEPPLHQLGRIDLFFADQPWAAGARAPVAELAVKRLQSLADALSEKQWLTGDFSIADIAMVTVLANLRHTDLLAEHDNLTAYLARAHARPAYQRAMAAQLGDFID